MIDSHMNAVTVAHGRTKIFSNALESKSSWEQSSNIITRQFRMVLLIRDWVLMCHLQQEFLFSFIVWLCFGFLQNLTL